MGRIVLLGHAGHDRSVAFDPAGIITRDDDLLPRSDVGLALIGRQFSIQFPTTVQRRVKRRTRGLVRIDHREDRIGKQRRSAGGFPSGSAAPIKAPPATAAAACAMKLRRFLSIDANMLFSNQPEP